MEDRNKRKQNVYVSMYGNSAPVSAVPSFKPEVEEINPSGLEFEKFSKALNKFFTTTAQRETLFKADINTDDLVDAYLDSLSEEERGHHDCNCCKKFLRDYGHLVTVDDDGTTYSAIWEAMDVSGIYLQPAQNMAELVYNRKVGEVFITKKDDLGEKVTNGWEHFSLKVPHQAQTNSHKSAFQVKSALREDLAILNRAITKYTNGSPTDVVKLATSLVNNESLTRTEKIKDRLAWFQTACNIRNFGKDKKKSGNLLYKMVAEAPAGWAHVPTSILGSLLDDLHIMEVDKAITRFNKVTDPQYYQRQQAAATQQQKEIAVKLLNDLGYTPALVRRFAHFQELQYAWVGQRPSEVKEEQDFFGKIGDAKAPLKSKTVYGTSNITFSRLQRKVLPNAKSMEVQVGTGNMNFQAFCTAEDKSNRILWQWDNHFSTFVYHNGSPASRWGLQTGWKEVVGIAMNPHTWGGSPLPNHAVNATFVIKGALPSGVGGMAIFPENLKSELHEVRKTIDEASKTQKLGGLERDAAVGLAMGETGSVTIRVDDGVTITTYCVNAWD